MLRRILGSQWLYYALAALLLVAAALTQVEVRLPSRPLGGVGDLEVLRAREDLNILFVVIDTLRADRLGSYGYPRETSPNLDRLAETGVRFARVEAQSTWTKASMASLWTSLYPVRTGVTRFAHALPDEARLPAEVLRDTGFRTGGIWRNHWVANNFGFGQGFETYYQPKPKRNARGFQRKRPGAHPLHGTDLDATQAALEFLRAYGHERFFLYVHYMDVHQYLYDQVAADAGFGTSLSDAYDAALNWTDRNVGMLLADLEARGLLDETLVVVASDHGEGFYEHGHEGHARTLYREVTEVPLILGLPFRLEEPVVVESLVRNVDIWPTLLDLLGLPLPERSDGRSLVAQIEAAGSGAGEASGEVLDAFAFLDRTWTQAERKPAPMVSVRTDRERLLYRADAPTELELYDHTSDPTEQHNLALQEPERAAELGAVAAAFLARKPEWGDSTEVEIDEMRRGQLRALGYVLDDGNELKPTQ
jgi:arylsulfatase A-like enzyme